MQIQNILFVIHNIEFVMDLLFQMIKANFIWNNRGIDLGALYDKIVRNEIKMKVDSSAYQSKQENSFNRLLEYWMVYSTLWIGSKTRKKRWVQMGFDLYRFSLNCATLNLSPDVFYRTHTLGEFIRFRPRNTIWRKRLFPCGLDLGKLMHSIQLTLMLL